MLSVLDNLDWDAIPEENKQKIKNIIALQLEDSKAMREQSKRSHRICLERIESAWNANMINLPQTNNQLAELEFTVNTFETGDNEPLKFLTLSVKTKKTDPIFAVPGTAKSVRQKRNLTTESAKKNGRNVRRNMTVSLKKAVAVPVAPLAENPAAAAAAAVPKLNGKEARTPRKNENYRKIQIYVSEKGTPLKID